MAKDSSGVVSKVEEMVGKKAKIRSGALLFNVRVLDYKRSYGKDRWLVEPTDGTGQMWVEQLFPYTK